MKRITNRTLHTPPQAAFAEAVENENGIVTVEYYQEDGSMFPFVPYTARVMREAAWEQLVTPPKEVKPKGKVNKAEKDPRQDKKVKKQADEHPARTVTDSDKAMGYKPDGDYEFTDLRQTDKPKQNVKSAAKHNKSFHDKVNEDIAIDTKYTWGSIEEAMYSAGFVKEDVQRLKMALFGDEAEIPMVRGESRLFREAPEDFAQTEDEYPVDRDIEAVDDALGSSEPTTEVYVDQDESDLRSKIVNLSSDEIEELNNLERNRRVKQVRIQDGKVIKVIPGTIMSTFKDASDGTIYARIKVANEPMKIRLATGDGRILVSKGRRSDILYSVRNVR